jgi:hypothetical protein
MVWRFVVCLWSREHDAVAAFKVASPLGAWVTQDHLPSNTLVKIVTLWNVDKWSADGKSRFKPCRFKERPTKDLSFYRLLEVIFFLTTFAPHTSYSHFYASRSSRRRKISSLLHINLFTNQFTTIDPVAWWSKDPILQLRAPSNYR